jgi:CheY-like chemotaxis protein
MVQHRVLIVDDQSDFRRALKAGLELLGLSIQAVDVPSAEEALLEFYRQPVDVLVSEIRLPGMTGLELMERLRRRRAEIKVILLSGQAEGQYRARLSQAGADAFFQKPVEPPEVLAAVQRCLGLTPAEDVQAAAEVLAVEEPAQPLTISDQLAALRQRLGATAVLLLGDNGKVLAQAGEFSEAGFETPLANHLMAAFSASLRVALLLGSRLPENLLSFGGPTYNLTLAPVGQAYALLVVTPGGQALAAPGIAYPPIRQAIQELFAALSELGVPLVEAAEAPAAQPALADLELIAELEEPDQSLEALFQDQAHTRLVPQDVNAFWDSLAEETPKGAPGTGDVLSYEEARRLGLAPEAKKK